MPSAVHHFADRLSSLGWVSDLLAAGSLATGDYIPGVSDLDLVALTAGHVIFLPLLILPLGLFSLGRRRSRRF